MKKTKSKKGGSFSKIIVLLVIFLNAVFAWRVLTIFSDLGNEPTVLIGAWFVFTGTELLTLATIRIKEDQLKADQEEVDYHD